MRRLLLAVSLGAAVSGAQSAACLLELDTQIACGDGYLDRAAGEVCDPQLPSTFEGRCETTDRPLGTAICDPKTCELRLGVAECGACGDGIVDQELGEECEDGETFDAQCPGPGTVACTDCRLDFSACEMCGNGETEPSEECDVDFGLLPPGQSCVGLAVPGLPELNYTYGNRKCRPDCRWDLTGCGLCGNGELDEFEIEDPETGLRLRPAEVCDGGRVNLEAARAECAPICQTTLPGISCNLTCDAGCLGLTLADPDDPGCCLLPGASRPAGAPPCCCELDNGNGGAGCDISEAPSPGADPTCPFPLG